MIMRKRQWKKWLMAGMTAAVLCLTAGCGNQTAEPNMDSNTEDNANVNDVTAGKDGNAVGHDTDNMGEDMENGMQDAGEDIKDATEDVGEGVKDVTEGVGEGAKDVTEGVGEGIKDVTEGVGEGVEDLTGGADTNNNGK